MRVQRPATIEGTIKKLARRGVSAAAAPLSSGAAYSVVHPQTGEITPTEAFADLTGTAFVTPFDSNWLVRGYFDWELKTAGFLFGILTNGSNAQLGASEAHTNILGRQVSTMEWLTGVLAAGTTIKLRAKRAGGSGVVYPGHTRLVAQRAM